MTLTVTEIKSPSSLSAQERSLWKETLRTTNYLDSPQLQPEFAVAVEQSGRPVEVAVLQRGNELGGFFSFSRTGETTAEPIGGITSDTEGLIVPTGVRLDLPQILRACQLKRWSFQHAPAAQAQLQPFHFYCDDSYLIDLPDGFQKYAAEFRTRNRSSFDQIQRKARKLEREVGPIEFVWHDVELSSLSQLSVWKQKQLKVKGYNDMFNQPWVDRLFAACCQNSDTDFQGVLSVLRAGRSVISIHLGLLSHPVFLSWIPTFNPDFAAYSPGAQLFLRLAEAAAERGIRRLDLGRGENQLKRILSNSKSQMAIGAAYTSGLEGRAAKLSAYLKRQLREWGFTHRLRKLRLGN